MKIKIGVSIYSVLNRSLGKLFDFIEEHDFEAVELWSSDFNSENKKILKCFVNEKIITSIHAPLMDLGNEMLVKQNIESLGETIRLANNCEANTIVLHTGVIDNNDPDDRLIGIEIAQQVINANIDLIKENGICLCIENVGYMENDLIINFEQLASFVDSFSQSIVGVAFDFAHANLKGNVKMGISHLGNRIKHVHISDNLGKVDAHHMSLGRGNINFELLRHSSITGRIPAIMEIEPDINWENNLLNSRKILQELKLT